MSANFMFTSLMQGQIDGNLVRAKFTLPERKRVSPPPKVVATASKKDGLKIDAGGADVEKGGPKRLRECMCLVVVILYGAISYVVSTFQCSNTYSNSYYQLLPLASLNPPCEGDLLSHEEVDLPDEI